MVWLPRHKSFERVYRRMVGKYGEEKGRRVYFAWVNKHGFDDSKPFPSYRREKPRFKRRKLVRKLRLKAC